jgi:SAM-dependent methyltransferase
MKLSEIVAYLNLLDSLSVNDEAAESTRRLAAVLHVVVNHSVQVNDCSQELEHCLNSVKSSLNNFELVLGQIKQRLTQMWHEQEPQYLVNSYQLFNQDMRNDTPSWILSRKLAVNEADKEALQHRLKNLTDWRYPGMIIGPRTESFIHDMVPMDPLYVVDTHEELLAPAVRQFHINYQRRLRQYVVDDYATGAILNELPGQQFGVIFAYNYFNFRPMETIRRYIWEIASKLRPGGTFIMTYNNCDRAHGIGLNERFWMCYTPKRLVIQAAESAGLQLVSSTDAGGDLSWIEFVRSGKIETLRGGQNLAKIIAFPQ